jgi:pimeloyl-ACP methyl ester carboxylesterase
MTARIPVVMIHGAFCGGWVFESWKPLFEAQGYEVHAPTLRHHEPRASQSELARTSMRDFADDLAALIDGVGAAPIVIGHSLGGLLAQMLAARGLVRALILLAPSTPWGMSPSTASEFLAAQALYAAGVFWRKSLAPRHWIAAANALDLVPKERQPPILERLVPESGRAMFEVLHWMFDASRATQVNPRTVACPVLCLVGARDRINPPISVRRLARRYGGRARYEELPNHSHWLVGEPGWERIAGGSLDWLSRILDRDRERAA